MTYLRLALLNCIILISLSVPALGTDVTVQANQIANFQASGLPATVTITVATTNSSTTVTSAALFRNNWLGISGFLIYIDSVAYYVSSVSSTSSLTLSSVYAGSTGSHTAVIYPFVLLRIYSNINWIPLNSSYVVQQGAPGSANWFKQVACSVVGGVLYIPQLELPATNNSAVPANRAARFYAAFYTFPSGGLITPYGGFTTFYVPVENLTTTWPQLFFANNPGTSITQNLAAFTSDQTLALLAMYAQIPSGGGTANQVVKFTPTGLVLGNSSITDDGALVTLTEPTLLSSTLTQTGISAPSVGSSSQGRVYTDTSGIPRVSEGGLAYMRQARPENVVDVAQYSTFAAAITAISSNTRTLQIATSQTVGANVTVPSNVTLQFVGSGALSVSAGFTVTINGPIIADPRQIFSGASTAPAAFGGSRILYLDPHWWGATGDGSTNDSVALQAMLNAISGSGGYTGDVYIAKGTYATTNMLTYEGTVSTGIRFHGALGGDRGPAGTVFSWTGATGGVVLYLLGVNGSNFSDFTILCNSTALYGLFIDATNEYGTLSTTAITSVTRSSNITTLVSTSHGLAVGDTIKVASVTNTTFNGTWIVKTAPDANTITYINGGSNGSSSSGTVIKYKSTSSSGNVFTRIGISNPNGTNSAAVALGHTATNTEQVSELDFYNMFLQGRQTLNNSYYGMKAFQSGNTKNFRVTGGTVDGFDYGLDFLNGSGIISISNIVMANMQVADIRVGTTAYVIKGVEVEDSATGTQFITGTTGNNPGSVTVEGCNWVGSAPAVNDVIINYSGSLVLLGNIFQNNRTGGSVAKIQISDPTFTAGSAGSVFSSGNFYQNGSGFLPVLDGSSNAVTPGSGVYANSSVSITSTNDYGGIAGAIVRLTNYTGGVTSLISQQASGNLVPSTCLICMAKGDIIKFRNEAGSGDIIGLSKDSSNIVQLGDTAGAKTGGPLAVATSLTVNSGTAITKIISVTAVLDFGSTGSGAVADLTVTVTGAAVGDTCILGVPNGSVTATATFSCWISASDTATVRFSPKATEDSASGTFRVAVIKF